MDRKDEKKEITRTRQILERAATRWLNEEISLEQVASETRGLLPGRFRSTLEKAIEIVAGQLTAPEK